MRKRPGRERDDQNDFKILILIPFGNSKSPKTINTARAPTDRTARFLLLLTFNYFEDRPMPGRKNDYD
jgi:hypothetical protein